MPRAAWTQRTRQGRLLAVWATGLVLCSAFGYLLTNQWMPHESDELFRELSLIENLHVYSEIDDVQFLRDLRESDLFNAESIK